MKVLVLGAEGWLGGMFYNYLKSVGVPVAQTHGDINSICYLDPDVTTVVNFAASASIDWCEKNKNATFWNNVLGAQNVAKVCKSNNVKHVFISSACVLQSLNEKDIKFEDSIPSPRCFYTETKLMAEKLIMEIDPTTLIVRLRLPISEVPHPRNVLNKLINYKSLIDCQESWVVVEDLLPEILRLIKEDFKGIRHVANAGTMAPSELGLLLGHDFNVFHKSDLDEEMYAEGRARRTSTIVGSKYGYLPPIRERAKDVVRKWRSYGRA